jgi:N-dimethylarginine dimethylaminohydrolase
MSETILLCPPVFYDIKYSINPWMKGESVDHSLAMHQWFQLKNVLSFLGVKIREIDQHPDLPDMVFTANAGTVRGADVVLSNFKHKERQQETVQFEKWFKDEGYNVHRLPKSVTFEGCGDTVINGDILIGGYGYRSDLKGLRTAADLLDLDLLPLKLNNPNFYHLDTCFTLLRPDLALYYPGAFSSYTVSKLKKHLRLIPVSEEEAHNFACNSIVYKHYLIIPAHNETLANQLEDEGIEARIIDTSEFLKSGGSLQCMALWI